MENVMMYELIFSAPHGSTIGYERKNDRIVPILNDDKEYNDIVAQFQKSAISIIENYMEYINYFDYVSKDFCVSFYQKFIEDRNYEDIMNFSELSCDYIIGNFSKYNYVNKVDNQELNNNQKLLEISKSSLWPYTFIKNGNFDSKTYYCYKSRLFTWLYGFSPLSHIKIYLDYGDGFNELDTTFVKSIKIDNLYKFKYCFSLDKKVYNLRIDPIENRKIILKDLHINSNCGEVSFVIPNKKIILSSLKKCIYIRSTDPRIIINNTINLKYIEFESIIELI